MESITTIASPPHFPALQRGVWCPLPDNDPIAIYLSGNLWDQPGIPRNWEVARLSNAVYLYRETVTEWAVAAKFYGVKTDAISAMRHAKREFENTQRVYAIHSTENQKRALRPLAVWQGILFLEYIDGLTLEDVIAVRRSRPGTLLPSLSLVAEFIANLHVHTSQPNNSLDVEAQLAKAKRIVETLVKHGVLQDDPITADGLHCLIDRWSIESALHQYVPTYVHGDATTTNFIFLWDGGIVGIDWERFASSDPASDLGRLLAEISHSLKQHGGSVKEAIPELEYVVDVYCQHLAPDWDVEAFLTRTRFYRAISTLRIARNGWISRLDRTALVAQALALLSHVG